MGEGVRFPTINMKDKLSIQNNSKLIKFINFLFGAILEIIDVADRSFSSTLRLPRY